MHHHLIKIIKGVAVLILVIVLTLGFVGTAQAGESISDYHAIVDENTVIDDDLFISGNTVEMNGKVNGDLFVSGERVYINGTVSGNLIASGAIVELNGVVMGSVFGAGYSIEFGPAADLHGSIYTAGFNIETKNGSLVGRSLYAAGYQVILNSEIVRDVAAACGSFTLDGTVGGDVKVELDEIENMQGPDGPPRIPSNIHVPDYIRAVEIMNPGIEISDSAKIGGELDYNRETFYIETPDVPDTTSITFHPERVAHYRTWQRVRERVGEFVALVIIGIFIIRYQKNNVEKVMAQFRENPFFSGLWGIAVILLFPLAFILTLIVLGVAVFVIWAITLGVLSPTAMQFTILFLGSVILVFGFTISFVSKAIFAYLVGNLLLSQVAPKALEGQGGTYWTILVGALLYELIRWIPILGIILAAAVILVGVGAIFNAFRYRRQPAQSEAI
jgi:hypothetical protein